MKLSTPLLAASAVCLFAATAATAFTIGPQTVVTKANSQAVTSPASRLSSTTLKMSATLDAQTAFAKSEIESNDVVVFSKSYCPFCDRTKALFTDLGVEIKVYELDQIGDDGPTLQHALLQMTGQKSVPNVFVKGEHIGGNDDLQKAARDGKLQEKLGL